MAVTQRFTEDQCIQMIDEDIRSRLIAMVSKKLDMATLVQAIPDVAQQERIRWSLNWSRLVLGRLFLDFLGIRPVLHRRRGIKPKTSHKDDVSVTDLQGKMADGLSDEDLDCLDSFMMHADKLVHFASHPDPPSEVEIDRAIQIILKALNTCLYEETGRRFPLSKETLAQVGMG